MGTRTKRKVRAARRIGWEKDMKKTLALLLIASVAAGIVAGCSKPAEESTTTTTSSTTPGTTAGAPKDNTPKMNETE